MRHRLPHPKILQHVTNTNTKPPSTPNTTTTIQRNLHLHSQTTHTTLGQYLSHARHTSLNPFSTTYQGTLYEYLTLNQLSTNYGFDLYRTGGRNDIGIDLQGYWNLPSFLPSPSPSPSHSPSPGKINVIVQCKNLGPKATASPGVVRELEGAFRGTTTQLGVLVCTRPATKGVREALGRSGRGLVWVSMTTTSPKGRGEVDEVVEEDEGGDENEEHYDYLVPKTNVVQFLYNAAAASKCGLEGVGVGLKYDKEGTGKNVQLLWHGEPIDFSKSHQDASNTNVDAD